MITDSLMILYCMRILLSSFVNCLQGDMLDFIMAVDDPVDWHQQNLDHNPTHYSSLQYSGPRGVAAVQMWVGQI